MRPQTKPFFDFVNERERIRIRRAERQPAPWTHDKILQEWYFCNVNREHDVCTRLVADHFRHPDQPTRIAWLVLARWLSREALRDACSKFGYQAHLCKGGLPYNEKAVRDFLEMEVIAVGRKVFHGAFMLRSPFGESKLDHIVKTAAKAEELMGGGQVFPDLSTAHAVALGIPLYGGFMAYELVTDLAHTDLIRDPNERWANLGPGALRGLALVFPDEERKKESQRLDLTLSLMDEANAGAWDHHTLYEWSPREAEHCLCEFAKYEAIRTGGRGKRHFNKGKERSLL